jgi:hypothetical protein
MRHRNPFCAVVLSAVVLAGGLCVLSAEPARSPGLAQATGGAQGGQTPDPAQTPASAQPAAPSQPNVGAGRSAPAPVWQGSQINRLSQRAEMYYETAWGVGELRVKSAESGELIRFNYRVVDPVKAAALNDKKAEPELIDSQAGIKLSVPQMEKVGKLRQSSTPKPGMIYWMAFANPTLGVKRGHRVDIVIGSFHANGLLVE